MTNRRDHVKLTGDVHPPEVELDPDIPATASALGVQGRMRMDPSVQDLPPAREDRGNRPRSRAGEWARPVDRTSGRAVAALVIGLVLLVLFRS
jgi:hypothetical protein